MMIGFRMSAPQPPVARVWVIAALLAPHAALGCACGCSIFDVGTASMFPSSAGATAFVEFDFLDQNHNWSGRSAAPAAQNPDKLIRTDFLTAGLQYQFDRSWGMEVEIPYWRRDFQTTEDGSIAAHSHDAPGDIRIKGLYTGFSDDMSTGLTFGVKLANGDASYRYFDPDTEIGTGSTDLLLGGYHLGNLGASGRWRYFAQAQWDRPVTHEPAYAPGAEWDAAAGIYYEGWNLNADLKVAPIAALSGTVRGHDGGARADPLDTGYTRLLLGPGIEADFRHLSVEFDVGLPVYDNASGNQLVASKFYRMNVSYRF